MTTPTIERSPIAELSARIRGRVFEPGQPGYDTEVTPFRADIVPSPALIVRATCAEDVQEAVRYAAARNLPIGVQATGHGIVTPYDGAVLISTRHMKGVLVNPNTKRARIQPGVIWQEVIEKTVPFGLIPLSGSTPLVGAVGYMLGGGLPVLGRKFGFAADYIKAIEIVTPDGELRNVTPAENADLFWALRGGKGNFGVVTSVEFELLEVEQVYGGAILFAGERLSEILPAWAEWSRTVPEEMCTSIGIFRFPPIPDVPEDFRGKFLVAIRVGYVGDIAEGERLLEPIRALGPVMDMVRPMPWTESASIHMDPDKPVPFNERSMTIKSVDPEVVQSLLDGAGPETDCTLLLIEIRLMGGAFARQPEVPSAVSHREAPYNFFAVTVAVPELAEKNAADFDRLFTAMAPHATGGAFVNFLNTDDAVGNTVKRAYDAERYARLQELKRKYDPQTLFRTHHTIR